MTLVHKDFLLSQKNLVQTVESFPIIPIIYFWYNIAILIKPFSIIRITLLY